MRESIAIETAPARPSEKSSANRRSLPGDWHAATGRAEHSRLAPSSILHNLYLKHRQFLPLRNPWQDNFDVRAVKLSSGNRSRSS